MAALSIRNLDETVKRRLQVRAARHGRSMGAEARAILTESLLEPEDAAGLYRRDPVRYCPASGRLATRNLSDFDGTGIEIIDPWALAGG